MASSLFRAILLPPVVSVVVQYTTGDRFISVDGTKFNHRPLDKPPETRAYGAEAEARPILVPPCTCTDLCHLL
jgi:hypothetical protein